MVRRRYQCDPLYSHIQPLPGLKTLAIEVAFKTVLSIFSHKGRKNEKRRPCCQPLGNLI
ncbi:hypothetical protein GPEL0_01r5395 [Geoanaerobacter pelophilus]|uniref:Transposase DDE domain-containing protein n=1 Tax=Geoanaerobacter pelophilus TaxID=60036 RepID=A0ABQ0MP53_9BACT|nr:hypothetical protein GPEL0_01r5395 [Geoanaerobacter pelophilus]